MFSYFSVGVDDITEKLYFRVICGNNFQLFGCTPPSMADKLWPSHDFWVLPHLLSVVLLQWCNKLVVLPPSPSRRLWACWRSDFLKQNNFTDWREWTETLTVNIFCPQWVLCGWSSALRWIWSRWRGTTPTCSRAGASNQKTVRRSRKSPSSSPSANGTNTSSTGCTTCTRSCSGSSSTTESTSSTRYGVMSQRCHQTPGVYNLLSITW